MWILYVLIYLLIKTIVWDYLSIKVSKHNWFPATDAPERKAFPRFKTQDGHSSSWTVYMILKCKSISWSRALYKIISPLNIIGLDQNSTALKVKSYLRPQCVEHSRQQQHFIDQGLQRSPNLAHLLPIAVQVCRSLSLLINNIVSRDLYNMNLVQQLDISTTSDSNYKRLNLAWIHIP